MAERDPRQEPGQGTEPHALTLVLVDDHIVVRDGLRRVLEAMLPCSVVGAAGTGREALVLVAQLRPSVLVVDMALPDLGGPEVIRQALAAAPQTRIVVLSMHADEGNVRAALRAGATAYVLKEARADELVEAVRLAVLGRRYLSPPLSERAIEAFVRQVDTATLDLYDTLTPRERDVLALTAEGHTTAAIAARFSLSTRTIEGYRAALMRKLGLKGHADLIRFALRRGILPLE